MADVPDSKSGPRKRVWVQVPPSVLIQVCQPVRWSSGRSQRVSGWRDTAGSSGGGLCRSRPADFAQRTSVLREPIGILGAGSQTVQWTTGKMGSIANMRNNLKIGLTPSRDRPHRETPSRRTHWRRGLPEAFCSSLLAHPQRLDSLELRQIPRLRRRSHPPPQSRRRLHVHPSDAVGVVCREVC
jgi:hypothetical protein